MLRSGLGTLFGACLLLVGTGCDPCFYDPDCDPGEPCVPRLEGWYVKERYIHSLHGACGTSLEDYLEGEVAEDYRIWSAGSWINIYPQFKQVCCADRAACHRKRLVVKDSATLGWNLHERISSYLHVDGPGFGKVYARAGDIEQLWGPLTLHVAAPESLSVNWYHLIVAEEPIDSLALAQGGWVKLVIKVHDESGHRLCGRSPLTADGNGSFTSIDSLYSTQLEGNSVFILTAADASTTSLELAVGEARRKLSFDVLPATAVTNLKVSFHKERGYEWIRFRAFGGEQEIGGARLLVENLTPTVYQFLDHEGDLEFETRSAMLELRKWTSQQNAIGRVRISAVGSQATPLEFEFTYP